MSVNNNFTPLAIYNTDKKELVYVSFCIAEATKIIFGHSTTSTEGIIRRAYKSGMLIRKERTKLDYNIVVREANTKQRKLLGKEKFINTQTITNELLTICN